MSRQAYRMSFGLIDETCPIVDTLLQKALGDVERNLEADGVDWKEIRGDVNIESVIQTLIDDIKSQATEKLREALTSVCEENIELQKQIDNLERENSNLSHEIEALGE